MDLGIQGRTALIGGASSGIGLASARALAAEGVRVALVARRQKETDDAAAAIARDFGVEAHPVIADLLEEGACERAVAETIKHFGGLDILVPNCGGPPKGHFPELSDQAWREGFELSYLTTVRLIRAALPSMQKQTWGRITTIGSIVVHEPRQELTLSSSIRTGLVALTRLLARQHGREGINVNMVDPGYTLTARQIELAGDGKELSEKEIEQKFRNIAAEIPLGRLAQPKEIGEVVAFLCSERAAFVSGVSLLVDGAHTRGI